MKLRMIAAGVLAVLCLSAAACSGNDTNTPANTDKVSQTAGNTEASGTADGTGAPAENEAAGLAAIAESVKQYYSDNVEFILKDDPYSEEVLMYTYGLYDEKYYEAVSDFVLTECDGMSADTFAIIEFKDGTDKALVEEAAGVMENEYVSALKKRLSAYNPEEFEAAGGYQLKVDGNSIMMVISSENADAILAAVGK